MNNSFVGRFFLNHYFAFSGRPILMDASGCTGPFTPGTVLPNCKDSGFNIVLRSLARAEKPEDPAIDVEPGLDADQVKFNWLGITEAEIERAKLIVKVLERIENS